MLISVLDWLYFIFCFLVVISLPSLYFCIVIDAISSNIDEVLSNNPSANAFVFRDFNIYHKCCLTYSGGSNDLTWWLTLLLEYLTVLLDLEELKIFCIQINIKLSYNLITIILVVITRPAQITHKKFAKSLQYLNFKKKVRDEVDFLCNEHHIFV